MDYALGAFAGLLIGDAAGATLEFHGRRITEDTARRAMTMPGGGMLSVGPGQITDDGELALALASVLAKKDPKNGYPEDDVYKAYHNWYKSVPFDMGATCKLAFKKSVSKINHSLPRVQFSQANGALMRILPLAIWAHNEDYETIANLAMKDSCLSHPNQVCQDANAVYCIAIAYLINNPKDSHGCINVVKTYIDNNITSSVREWFYESMNDIHHAQNNIGHVKWAFLMAFYHLKWSSTYEDAIFQTLSKGGDTDTNAAIVGGIIGALHGIEGIPQYMYQPVMNFDCTRLHTAMGQTRPEIYRASNYKFFVKTVFANMV